MESFKCKPKAFSPFLFKAFVKLGKLSFSRADFANLQLYHCLFIRFMMLIPKSEENACGFKVEHQIFIVSASFTCGKQVLRIIIQMS
jgi:hypothetical protein